LYDKRQFRVKISGTTYTGSFIRLTRNQQKEAPITECKHVIYSTESRLSLEVLVFWLVTVEVLSSWIGLVEPSVVTQCPAKREIMCVCLSLQVKAVCPPRNVRVYVLSVCPRQLVCVCVCAVCVGVGAILYGT
jgi:hypothetical protein